MFRKIGRLFTIKTRFEAWAVIYAVALGAVDRGFDYVERFPGVGGWIMFSACTAVVFMVGAKLLDLTRKDNGERRRGGDFAAVPASEQQARPAG
jgi:hypothetical protein